LAKAGAEVDLGAGFFVFWLLIFVKLVFASVYWRCSCRADVWPSFRLSASLSRAGVKLVFVSVY
jgi:hypothetical protein